jgi:hypothetical protein
LRLGAEQTGLAPRGWIAPRCPGPAPGQQGELGIATARRRRPCSPQRMEAVLKPNPRQQRSRSLAARPRANPDDRVLGVSKFHLPPGPPMNAPFDPAAARLPSVDDYAADGLQLDHGWLAAKRKDGETPSEGRKANKWNSLGFTDGRLWIFPARAVYFPRLVVSALFAGRFLSIHLGTIYAATLRRKEGSPIAGGHSMRAEDRRRQR